MICRQQFREYEGYNTGDSSAHLAASASLPRLATNEYVGGMVQESRQGQCYIDGHN